VPVRATLDEEFEVRPSRLYLGFVGPRSHPAAETTVIAHSLAGPPLRLLPQRSARFGVTLRREAGGRRYRLAVTPKGAMPLGRLAGAVELIAGTRKLRIPVTGYVDPALE
jgi:hypothetical protein